MRTALKNILNPKKLWRIWLRNESPRREVLDWSQPSKIGLITICIVVSLVTAWKPDLAIGTYAPFDLIATKDVSVINTKAIEEEILKEEKITFMQVINKQESRKMKESLKNKLKDLEKSYKRKEINSFSSLEISEEEKLWLERLTTAQFKEWTSLINVAANRMLSQGLAHMTNNQLLEATSIQLSQPNRPDLPGTTLGSKLLTTNFSGKSNLNVDQQGSKVLRKQKISQKNTPRIHVKKDDIITKKGRKITPLDFAKLRELELVSQRQSIFTFSRDFFEAIASCGVLMLIMRREKPSLQARHALLSIFLLLIAQIITKSWSGASISPVLIIIPPTLLLSQAFGSTSAFAWIAISNILWQAPIEAIGERRMIVAFAASAVVALLGGRIRSRAQLLQMAVLLPFGSLLCEWVLLGGQVQEPRINEALALGGVLLLTILLIPILESAFGLITKARLLELADQERPLLRKLSSEAPGTFEHTLMICGLAEEGARTIGADVDLIRTGALYHDVGKLHAPQWFIENQTDGTNPHEDLNDPHSSAAVLQAHVDEGLKLARKNRLPKPISDFIPEHQGTLKMGYFLHQARQINPEVQERDFRYKGPIPRSRETAILMLADGCEAALRCLGPEKSDLEASQTVRRIIESRQLDGQLKASSLSRSEVELVTRAFVRVWRRMRHRRIPYPIPLRSRYQD
ncbi:HDIG domain-containing metalloprotein [Prochlorococcus sp. MIT 1300]|uniref:HDIG domain-containing metalloprotein n=1 Tax=Prochlorococcus sp. MIT 1300 TaxID=3096218 RepID=UPI002A759C86|nr:HDIG domain-containing metalloprotein [Prochlorococcus sp. MIT 1300]